MLKLSNMLKLDFTLITRDKVLLYMALSPVLLALVFMAVIGGASAGTLNFVADTDLPPAMLQNLERLGRVQRAGGYAAVVARVDRMDSAAGVYLQGDRPVLLLEGNEPAAFGTQAGLLLARAVAGDIPEFVSRQVESAGDMVVTVTRAVLLLLAIFMGGLVSGLNIVGERESRALRALAISPLSLAGFLGARTAVALLLALASVAMTTAVLGVGAYLPLLLLATLASAPLCGLMALVLGVAADNQITAIATLKWLMPASFLLPISSVFVSAGFKFLYWWVPMYWQYEAVTASFSGQLDPTAVALTLATSLAWLAVLSGYAGRKLGLHQV